MGVCGGGGGGGGGDGIRRQYGIISGQAMSASGGEDKKTSGQHLFISSGGVGEEITVS